MRAPVAALVVLGGDLGPDVGVATVVVDLLELLLEDLGAEARGDVRAREACRAGRPSPGSRRPRPPSCTWT